MGDQEGPTMEDVQVDEARLEDMKRRLEEQRAHLQTTEQRIRAVYRSGEGDADALAHEMAAAKARVEGLEGAIEDLQEKITEDRETALKGKAARRLDPGLKRAVGSLIAEFERDEQKVIRKAKDLIEAIDRLHGRRQKVANLRIEADCLRARWPHLPKVDLPSVPRVSKRVREALMEAQRATEREPRFRDGFEASHSASADAEEKRRGTLKALKRFLERGKLNQGSETARILSEAGIPEPEPTEIELEIVRRRKEQEEREAREMERFG